MNCPISDDIPAVESDSVDKKMPSDEFIEDILSAEKLETTDCSSFNCTECDLNFDTKDKFDLHTQSTSHSNSLEINTKSDTKKPFQCPECHKIFAENKILKRHLKIHSPVKPHVCTECNMSFTESSNLSKHMKKHTGELRNVVGKPNLCSVCGKGLFIYLISVRFFGF